jgi:hypothetical protein
MALRDIIELEKDGPCPKDFDKVDKVHQSLDELEARKCRFPPHTRPRLIVTWNVLESITLGSIAGC